MAGLLYFLDWDNTVIPCTNLKQDLLPKENYNLEVDPIEEGIDTDEEGANEAAVAALTQILGSEVMRILFSNTWWNTYL